MRIRISILAACLFLAGTRELLAQGACKWIAPADDKYNALATCVYGLVSNTDGSLVLAGSTKDHCCGAADGTHSYLFLMKLNSSGTLAWVNSIGGDSYETTFPAAGGGNPLIATSDGGYAIACNTPITYGGIVKTNSTGTWQWTVRVADVTTPNEYFSDLVQSTDGGYIGVGASNSAPSSMFAAKIDATGSSVVWTHYVSLKGAYNSIIKTSDGGYALCGYEQAAADWKRAYIVKMDASFTRQWDVSFGTSACATFSSEIANDIKQTADGGYIVAAQKYMNCGNGNQDCYAIKINSSGGLQWTKVIGSTTNYTAGNSAEVSRSVAIAADGGYVFAGSTNSFIAGSNRPDIYLMKLNTDGTFAWQKNVGLNGGGSNGNKLDDSWCLVRSSAGQDIYLAGQTTYSNTCSGGTGAIHIGTVSDPSTGFLAEIASDGSVCCATTTTASATSQGTDNTNSSPALVATTRGVRTTVAASTCAVGQACGTPCPCPPAPTGCQGCNAATDDFAIYSAGYCEVAKSVCGSFTVTPNVLLPVQLTSMSAVCNAGMVECTWTTASEINNNYFTIERSMDGKIFKEAGKVTGAGNSSSPRKYEFIDEEIPLHSDQTFYYRLKQTDFDGKSEYYGIIPVDCSLPEKWNLVLRNIFYDGELNGTLIVPGSEEIFLTVLDGQGKEIRTDRIEAVKGSNLLKMDLSALSKGVYFLKLFNDHRNLVKPFVKF